MEYGVVASLWNGYDYTNAPAAIGADATTTNNTSPAFTKLMATNGACGAKFVSVTSTVL